MARKLDDRSEPMILLGYHPTGAYKLYDPRSQKIVISRDVLVDEANWWNWDDQPPKSNSILTLNDVQSGSPHQEPKTQPQRP